MLPIMALHQFFGRFQGYELENEDTLPRLCQEELISGQSEMNFQCLLTRNPNFVQDFGTFDAVVTEAMEYIFRGIQGGFVFGDWREISHQDQRKTHQRWDFLTWLHAICVHK